MSFKYLANPYNDSNEVVRELRFRAARDATMWFMQQRLWVFSPIVHCHEIAVNGDLPKDHEYWLEYDFHMLDVAKSLIILTLPGS